MAVYQITTLAPDARIDTRLQLHYAGQHFKWGDRVWFVRGTDQASVLAQKIGVRSTTPAAAGLPPAPQGDLDHIVITQLFPSYWGWAQSDLWGWLQASFQMYP